MKEETKSTTKKADTPPNQAVNELSQFLAPLAEGTLVPDYVNKLHELVQAVGEVRSGGEIILKIKISPMRGTVNQMAVHSEVISKPPAAPKPMSLFFASENGGLHRSDPRQAVFGFDEGK